MKKVMILFLLTVFLIGFTSAATCNLNATLFNQDPYPAVPGDYVKLVFQVTGIENPECTNVKFSLIPDYPISFDSGVASEVQIKGGSYVLDYSSYLQVPFKVRVDENAIDGDNPIKVKLSNSAISTEQTFNLNVEDTRVDFDVFVKDYEPSTGTLTLQVLNIGSSDIEALTVEIPKQNDISIKGSNKNVIGSLSSNEDTTTEFEAYFSKENNFNVILSYNDKNDIRRATQNSVYFNPEYFQNRNGDSQQGIPTSYYLIGFVIIGLIIYFVYKRMKKKKLK